MPAAAPPLPPAGKYIIDPRTMGALQKHAVVLHPLPRVDEVGGKGEACLGRGCLGRGCLGRGCLGRGNNPLVATTKGDIF